MIAWNPKKASRKNYNLGETSYEVQASHPWLPNKTLIFMEDLSSSYACSIVIPNISLIPFAPYLQLLAYPYVEKGRKTRPSMKEKSLSS
ncbi:hypothetical protein CRYUN_Cryun17cG0003600 [Craigia yunnanensis]